MEGKKLHAEDLLQKYRIGHQSIVDALVQVQGAARSYQGAKPKLRDLREILLGHFSQQNDDFYKSIESAYPQNRENLKILEFLSHDLKDIKIKYLLFFDKHSGEMADTNARTFPLDLSTFSAEVLGRIRMEEEYLFPLLKNLPADNS